MFEFCQTEKRWQVHYRLVCSTFCSQKAFQKSVWKEIRQYFKYLKRIKAFQNALSCMTNNKNRMWIMSTKLGTASFASIVNYLDVAQDATVPCRQRTGHRDSPNKASYYFYNRLSLAVDWETIFCISFHPVHTLLATTDRLFVSFENHFISPKSTNPQPLRRWTMTGLLCIFYDRNI